MAVKPKKTLRSVGHGKKKNKHPGVYEQGYVVDGRFKGLGLFVAGFYNPAKTGGKDWVKGGPWQTPTEAYASLLAKKAELAQGATVRRSQTIQEFFDQLYWPEYTATTGGESGPNPRRRHKPGAIKSTHYGIKPFLTAFGSARLDNLDDIAIRQWGLSAPLNNMKYSRTLLNAAIRAGLLSRNPLAGLGREESKGRSEIDIISEDELYELADCAIEALGADVGMNFRAHLIFSAFTCMRPAEVEALLKVNVLRDRVQVRRNVSGGIEVDSPKNGKWRNHVPLSPAARAVLDALPQTPTPYQFHNKRGQKLSKSTQHLYWDLTRATMAAKTGDSKWRTMDLYELRHFGASFAWNILRLPVEVVAWMLGHSDTKLVTELYGHPDHEIWHGEVMDAFRRHDAKKAAQAAEAAGVPRLRAVE